MKVSYFVLSIILLLVATLGISATSITLNTPSNNYAWMNSSINVACTFTGSNISNVSFYTNITGSFISNRTISIFSTNATHSTLPMNGRGDVASMQYSGLKIRALVTTYLTGVNRNESNTADHMYIKNGSRSNLVQVNFTSGDYVEISPALLLEGGKYYYFEFSNRTASWKHTCAGAGITMPTNYSEIIEWVNGSFDGNDEGSGYFCNAKTLQITAAPTSGLVEHSLSSNIPFTWNCLACESNNTCVFGSSNYTIFPFTTNYNSSVYDTSNQAFSFSGYGLNSAYLNYNGTRYSTTISSNNGSRTIGIENVSASTTKNIFWEFNGGVSNSSVFTQTVNPIYFGICNSSNNVPYANYTIKDESTLATIYGEIPTSTFEYWIDDSTYKKTYSFINNTGNRNYQFCTSPGHINLNIDPYIQYKNSTSYPQRTYDISTALFSNVTSQISLYLLSTTAGSYVTFQVINTADQVISDVLVTATRSISGSDVNVSQGTTGADGTTTFWLNPDFAHTLTFSKTGYTTYSTSITPTQTSYTITLSGGSVTTNCSSRGIQYTITPLNSSLNNDTTYSFGMLLTSSYWDVSDYGFNLRLSNRTIITGGNTGTEGTQLSKSYNTGNQSIIYLDYYYIVNGCQTSATRIWTIQNTAYTDWSIKVFFTDLNLYLSSGLFGLDDFGKNLIVFLILFISCGVVSYKYGIGNPLAIVAITWAIIFFLEVVIDVIPVIRGIDNLLTYITSLVLVLLILKEVQQQ